MNSFKPLKKKVSITLDETVADKIQLLADEDDRNFSQYINMVLRRHLTSKDESQQEKQNP